MEATEAVKRLLQEIGEDPERDGLLETPARVVKALQEMTVGYGMDPAEILSKRFECSYDSLIVLRRVQFTSLCEHHLLPFSGYATVAYLPRDCVVGISKLARLTECFARRLQIQERITEQIAGALNRELKPLGVGVVLQARHSCMMCRGVKQMESEMITSTMLGALRDNAAARAELLTLAMG